MILSEYAKIIHWLCCKNYTFLVYFICRPTCDQSNNEDDFVVQYQDDGRFSRDIENNDSHTVQQLLLSNEDDR